jgi:hypothetical protein
MNRVIVVDPTDSVLVDRIAEEHYAIWLRRSRRENPGWVARGGGAKRQWADIPPESKDFFLENARDCIEAINAVFEPEPTFSRGGVCLNCGCAGEREHNDDDY